MKKTSFKNITSFKTGGEILHFFEVDNEKDLTEKVKFAKKEKLPIFIIGSGSDILVSDEKFKGVVIKLRNKDIKTQDFTNYMLITSSAGLKWNKLVNYAVEKNLQGIECLAGIPGTVGAAPIQNIGAYGQELSETLVNVHVFDIKNEKFFDMTNKDCQFGYRDSFFKSSRNWQKYVIYQVTLKLNKNKKPKVKYDSIKKFLPQDPSLKEVRDVVVRVRSHKLEDPKKVPNAGSYFKNPVIDKKTKEKIEKNYTDAKFFETKGGYKIFAGFLIEKAGWKGKSLGPVKVSDKHALILTNPNGKGDTKDVLRLAEEVKNAVHKKFNIKLEPEVQYINFD